MSILDKVKIDGYKFSRAIILSKVKRRVNEYIELIGQKRLLWLLENDKDLASFIPPETLCAVHTKAQQNAFIAEVVSDQDIADMIPKWLKKSVVKKGDAGLEWLARQILWLKSLFTG